MSYNLLVILNDNRRSCSNAIISASERAETARKANAAATKEAERLRVDLVALDAAIAGLETDRANQ